MRDLRELLENMRELEVNIREREIKMRELGGQHEGAEGAGGQPE